MPELDKADVPSRLFQVDKYLPLSKYSSPGKTLGTATSPEFGSVTTNLPDKTSICASFIFGDHSDISSLGGRQPVDRRKVGESFASALTYPSTHM